ncbi:L-threonylcarbamoyladenylate synthase [Alkaliphilus oremlandii]|nr:L-threonylcarbamoyladenylate synthase [Alkaliphilus oremlandii]
MKDTMVIGMEPNKIDRRLIVECGSILRNGGVVAFPTETVYGLGANALDANAIKKIFEAKGRPSDNPLIVHIAKKEDVIPLVKNIPEIGRILMEKFWPGPLTLLFEKSDIIPNEVTAGLSTVGIRMPSHPIAGALIEAAQVPVAAPSANTSGRPSPTKGQHVIEDMMGRVDAIISGGECNVGLESTVLDITGDIPMILRPGGVTKEMLEAVLGQVAVDAAIEDPSKSVEKPKSPGMKYTHYAPKADVIVVEGPVEQMVMKIKVLEREYRAKGKRVGIICTEETKDLYGEAMVKSMGSRQVPETIAACIFKVLREFDETDVDIILSEAVEAVEIGQAIMNRLKKAAGYRIIHAEE